MPSMVAEETPEGYLGRMLHLLELVVDRFDRPVALTELAGMAGVPVSTTSRLLSQLREWGFLAEADGRHTAGPRLIRLSAEVMRSSLGDGRLEAATRALLASTGESATAGRVVGDRLLIVARSEPTLALRAVNRIGEQVPIARSAMGKALLSALPPTRRYSLVAAECGDSADEVLAGVAAELTAAADVGYACDEEQLTTGLRCRAVPILGFDGTAVAALSVGGPTSRFTAERANAAVDPLREQADALSVVRRTVGSDA